MGEQAAQEAQESCYFPPSAIPGVRQDELKGLPPGSGGARATSQMEEDGDVGSSCPTEFFKGMLATGALIFLSLWERGGMMAGRT